VLCKAAHGSLEGIGRSRGYWVSGELSAVVVTGCASSTGHPVLACWCAPYGVQLIADGDAMPQWGSRKLPVATVG
jgi:hypothetical protein